MHSVHYAPVLIACSRYERVPLCDNKVLAPTTNPMGPSVNNLTGTKERHTQDMLSLHNTSLHFWYKTQNKLRGCVHKI